MWVWISQSDFAAINTKLDAILTQLGVDHRLLQAVKTEEDQIMATVDEVQADVVAEDAAIDKAITLLNGLAALLKAAGTDPAKLDALHADIVAKTQALAEAVTANS